MNFDFRVIVGITTHPKTLKLEMLRPDGLRLLIRLWEYTSTNAPSGDIELSAAQLDAVLEPFRSIDGSKGATDALLQVGFLERKRNGQFRVHNWKIWNPYARRSKERTKKARKAADARYKIATKGRAEVQQTEELHASSMDLGSAPTPPHPIPTPPSTAVDPSDQRPRDAKKPRQVAGPIGDLLRVFNDAHREVYEVPYSCSFAKDTAALKRVLKTYTVPQVEVILHAFWREQQETKQGGDGFIGRATPSICGMIGQIPNIIRAYPLPGKESHVQAE